MKTHDGEEDNREPLPLDMVIEILTKLPAKSLFRFRCVSKKWCSIIRSRSFTDSFMSRPRLLLHYDTKRGTERRLFFISLPLHPQDPNHSSSVSKYDVAVNELYRLCNSVLGIICVSHGESFLICNPTTRQVITIPHDPTDFYAENNVCVMRLGYDKSNDQYKIMRTVTWWTKSRSTERSVCTLRLGEQSSFSSWRRVESGDEDHFFLHTNSLCINGVVYYGAQENYATDTFIVSFDVGSEQLILVEAPRGDELVHLINYQGKLGCFCCTSNSYSLWILDDARKQIWWKTCIRH